MNPQPTGLCRFRNLFGEPRKGLHSYRLFDVAIVDVAATILVAVIISRYYSVSLVPTLAILIVVGMILHRLFCVNTRW